jgi:hypothetical protein
VDCSGPLPFGGYAQNVDAVVARGKIANAANVANYDFPYVSTEQGSNRDRITLRFSENTVGSVSILARIDN